MQTLGEFHDLKSKMLEKEESIVDGIKGDTPEEETFKILKWFRINEASLSMIRSISFSPCTNETHTG